MNTKIKCGQIYYGRFAFARTRETFYVQIDDIIYKNDDDNKNDDDDIYIVFHIMTYPIRTINDDISLKKGLFLKQFSECKEDITVDRKLNEYLEKEISKNHLNFQ